MILYTKEQINEIKSKVDYFNFYQKYIDGLQNNKTRIFVNCPFHLEQKPSFQIDLNYGIWKCWGENISGDIFYFYQKHFGVTFNEAVQQIAEMYNVTLEVSEEELEKRKIKKSLLDINKLMCEKFQLSLNSNNNAYNYITEIREFSPKIIQDFKIGCGINKLPEKESLKSLGLLVQNTQGQWYPKFRTDRIILPRFDENGNIVSFTGRLCEDKDLAKYMHTSDTEIYKKSEHIFGLYQAKKYIKHFNSVILAEGELDCIKCHQKGIVNTVSISGLNMSDTQVNLLKKYTNNFYICVEDEAILRESEKRDDITGERITPLSKLYNKIHEHIPYAKVYIIDLRNKDGSKCDPDMYLSTHTRDEFKELIKQAKIYNEYIIGNKLKNINPKNIEEKTACLNSLIPILSSISNFLDRKQYIELVSNVLMIPQNDIYKKIKWYTENKDKLESENITWDNRPIYAQKTLLSLCFCDNFNTVRTALAIKNFALEYMEPFYKELFSNIIKPYIETHVVDNKVDYNDFFLDINYNKDINELTRKTLYDIYMKIENFEDFDPEDVEELIFEQVETLKEWSVPTSEVSLEDFSCLTT